jgi:hypothetical protein
VGRAVAVNMVWLIVVTTVQEPRAATTVRVAPVVAPVVPIPPVESIDAPPLKRSDRLLTSTTA